MTIESTINNVMAVKYSPTDIQRLSMKLVDDFMGGIHDYAYSLGEKTEDAYYSLKWYIMNKLGKFHF